MVSEKEILQVHKRNPAISPKAVEFVIVLLDHILSKLEKQATLTALVTALPKHIVWLCGYLGPEVLRVYKIDYPIIKNIIKTLIDIELFILTEDDNLNDIEIDLDLIKKVEDAITKYPLYLDKKLQKKYERSRNENDI